jgi:hypothetical protein
MANLNRKQIVFLCVNPVITKSTEVAMMEKDWEASIRLKLSSLERCLELEGKLIVWAL